MGAISKKLDYLMSTKLSIKNALIKMGQEVSSDDTFRSYADKILNISPEHTTTKVIQKNTTLNSLGEVLLFADVDQLFIDDSFIMAMAIVEPIYGGTYLCCLSQKYRYGTTLSSSLSYNAFAWDKIIRLEGTAYSGSYYWMIDENSAVRDAKVTLYIVQGDITKE